MKSKGVFAILIEYCWIHGKRRKINGQKDCQESEILEWLRSWVITIQRCQTGEMTKHFRWWDDCRKMSWVGVFYENRCLLQCKQNDIKSGLTSKHSHQTRSWSAHMQLMSTNSNHKKLIHFCSPWMLTICLQFLHLIHENQQISLHVFCCLVFSAIKTSFFIKDISSVSSLCQLIMPDVWSLRGFDNFDMWWLLNELTLESQAFVNALVLHLSFFLSWIQRNSFSMRASSKKQQNHSAKDRECLRYKRLTISSGCLLFTVVYFDLGSILKLMKKQNY